MAGERQLVFPFVQEQNKLEGKTCSRCKHYSDGICETEGSMNEEDTCEYWELNDQIAQEKDSFEFMEEYIDLMEKYKISKKDSRKIYQLANLF